MKPGREDGSDRRFWIAGAQAVKSFPLRPTKFLLGLKKELSLHDGGLVSAPLKDILHDVVNGTHVMVPAEQGEMRVLRGYRYRIIVQGLEKSTSDKDQFNSDVLIIFSSAKCLVSQEAITLRSASEGLGAIDNALHKSAAVVYNECQAFLMVVHG